jgi:DNA-binding LacI/PurR family transcriptional regulator
MGERAAGLLIDLIQLEDHTIPPHTTVLGVTLVERESTAPPARRIVG